MKNSFGVPMFNIVLLSVCAIAQSSLFYQQNAPWFQDISSAPLDAQSSEIITWLNGQGGWGGGVMQIDFSIDVLFADASTPMRSFVPNSDFYEGECDRVQMPVPLTGHLEGEEGYACTGDGDCHLIVFKQPERLLYEMWRADIVNTTFSGGCLAVWNLDLPYNPLGRGDQCTSADAAGLPIAPLLFTADEVASGNIDHAIRFILPNSRIRNRTYVRPATHATGAASGGQSAPPYGTRLRLRANYDVASLPNPGSRVVARAFQKYGIVLADGGTIALTARDDRSASASWDDLLGPRDLAALKVTDFEMVDGGTRYRWEGDCERVHSTVQQAAWRSMQRPRIGTRGEKIFVQYPGQYLNSGALLRVCGLDGKTIRRAAVNAAVTVVTVPELRIRGKVAIVTFTEGDYCFSSTILMR